MKISSEHYVKNGFTLIEVLASIALLGVLLSTTLVAIGRHTKQARAAQNRIEALGVADNMLRVWLVENEGQIEAKEGTVAGHADWYWQVVGQQAPGLEPLGAHIGRLEILSHSPGQDEKLLASLEFVSTSPITAGSLVKGAR